MAAIRFARGKGETPPMQDCFRAVPFDVLEQPFGGLPDGTDELFTRYLRVKIQGINFCGRGYYHVPLVEGRGAPTIARRWSTEIVTPQDYWREQPFALAICQDSR